MFDWTNKACELMITWYSNPAHRFIRKWHFGISLDIKEKYRRILYIHLSNTVFVGILFIWLHVELLIIPVKKMIRMVRIQIYI